MIQTHADYQPQWSTLARRLAIVSLLITPLIGTVRVIVVYLLRKIRRQNPFPGQVPIAGFGAEFRSPIQSTVESGEQLPLT